jgi:hypothetical protein
MCAVCFSKTAGTFNHYMAKKPRRKSPPDTPAVEQFKMMAKIGKLKKRRCTAWRKMFKMLITYKNYI